jgi:hypothetical protein
VEKPEAEAAVGEPAGSAAANSRLEGPPKQSYWPIFKPGSGRTAEKAFSVSDTRDKPL